MSFFSDGLIKKLEKELKTQASSKCFSVLAQIYYEQGDYKRAEKLCLDGLKYHPSHLSAFLLLTDIYISLDKNHQAFQYLNRAKIISPEHPKIYEKLARLYTRQNKMEESIEAYKTLLMLRPDHPVALDMLSYLEPFISSKEAEASPSVSNLNPKEEAASVDLEETPELKEKANAFSKEAEASPSVSNLNPKEEAASVDLEETPELKEKANAFSKEAEASISVSNLNPKEEAASVDLEETPELKEKVDILEELEKLEKSISFDLTKKNTFSDDLEKKNDEESSLDNNKKQLSLEKANLSKKETADSIVGKNFGIKTLKSNPTQSFKPQTADPKNSMFDIETLLTKESEKSQKSETIEENKTELKKQKLLRLNQMLAQVESYIEKSRV